MKKNEEEDKVDDDDDDDGDDSNYNDMMEPIDGKDKKNICRKKNTPVQDMNS